MRLVRIASTATLVLCLILLGSAYAQTDEIQVYTGEIDKPGYDPRYAIPLLGMILGNCMTGVGLGLTTLTTSLVNRRASVEAQLMLGATREVAAAPVMREALRSALMPTINSMAATGVVSLPGMMTGQILGGVPPAEAVKYQILVMFLIAGGTGLGAVTAVLGGVYRLTDGRHRLRLDRLTAAKAT